MAKAAEQCEEILWDLLIESGAMVDEHVTYSEILADCARTGTLESGLRGAVLLTGEVKALRSWFVHLEHVLTEEKGGKLTLSDFEQVGKVSYRSTSDMLKTFGKHIQGNSEDSLERAMLDYNPATEFVFVRLYAIAKNEFAIYHDVVEYVEPSREWQIECRNKLKIAPAAPTVPQMLLFGVNLRDVDKQRVSAGNFQLNQVPEMLKNQRCGQCGADAPKSLCSACHVVKYCDKTCSTAHWSAAHKRHCKFLKDAAGKLQ